MTGAQRARLERRRTALVNSGARPDRAGSVRDRELVLLVDALNHGRRRPAARRTSAPARPLYNVSDVGGYYRPGA